MAEGPQRERVLVLADRYRILGEVQVAPDGTLYDFKQRAAERFMVIHNAQFFTLSDGKRVYDSEMVELNKDCVVAVFKERDLAFVRKEVGS